VLVVFAPSSSQAASAPHPHRRSVRHLVHEFVKDIVSFDSRILRTVRALVIEPGELPLAFREGRTQRYMPSVRLYFFVSLLFFLFLSVTGIALMQITLNVTTERFVADKAGNVFIITNGKRAAMDGFKADAKGRIYLADKDAPHVTLPTAKADGSVDNKVDTDIHYFQRIGGVRQNMTPAVKAALASMEEESLADAKKGNASGGGLEAKIFAAMQKLETNPAALNGPLMTWIPRILFLLLPLFALLLAAFYRRLRNEFYFVDHLVFSLTIHTFAFIVLILAAIAATPSVSMSSAFTTSGRAAVSLNAAATIFLKRHVSPSGKKRKPAPKDRAGRR